MQKRCVFPRDPSPSDLNVLSAHVLFPSSATFNDLERRSQSVGEGPMRRKEGRLFVFGE